MIWSGLNGPDGSHQFSAMREKLAISVGSTETREIFSGAVSVWAMIVCKAEHGAENNEAQRRELYTASRIKRPSLFMPSSIVASLASEKLSRIV